ncbi:MAG: S41 family peptidase, partial [Negativicutes bacterium]
MKGSGKIRYFIAGILAAAVLLVGVVLVVVWVFDVSFSKTVQMARFIAAMRYVEVEYVDEVDPAKLMDGAIAGMVKSLGDPYSVYLSPEMYQRMKDHTSGQFGGIGVVMGFEDGVNIISVMPGTPGEAAGLRVGDKIQAVDGTPVEDLGPEEVALHIRGKAGTEVVLTIRRSGEEPKDYVITRDNIHVRTAAGQMLSENIGYIRISSFAENTAQEFQETYDELTKEGMKGMVIDLRANPGGFIKTCVDIAQQLVPKGPVVSVVQRDGTRQEYDSDLAAPPYPLVVLIDGNSASASEILAGALQDTGAATLVGTTSYGKGSVQMVMPIPGEDDAIKLTIAKYYTPNGRSINGTGIEPDIAIVSEPGAAED